MDKSSSKLKITKKYLSFVRKLCNNFKLKAFEINDFIIYHLFLLQTINRRVEKSDILMLLRKRKSLSL